MLMKKAALVGDSVCAWYSRCVAEQLQGKCEVICSNEQNGRFAAFTLHRLTSKYIMFVLR